MERVRCRSRIADDAQPLIIRPLGHLQPAPMRHLSQLRPHLLEQFCRDLAVKGAEIPSAADRADVGAWPDETVELVGDDPATPVAEAEMVPHRGRYFYGGAAVPGLLGGEGHDEKLSAVRALLRREDDDDRPLFRSLIASLCGFAGPEIDVGEYVSRLGDRP